MALMRIIPEKGKIMPAPTIRKCVIIPTRIPNRATRPKNPRRK
jgi:hypothetical protein